MPVWLITNERKMFEILYLNIISFKCPPLLFRQKRILTTAFIRNFPKHLELFCEFPGLYSFHFL